MTSYLNRLYLRPAPDNSVQLPAGALFDFDPEQSITEDQISAAAISTSGSYTATADALQKSGLKRVTMDGTNPFTAAWPAALSDYSADMPFTVYCVVRSSEFDEGAYLFSAYAETNSSTNRILGQLVGSNARQNRIRIDSSAGVGFEDDTDGAAAPGTIQILAYEFNSLSQGRKSYDDTLGSLQNHSNGTRDPNDLDTFEIGGMGGGGVWNGDYFRCVVYPSGTDQDVLDALASIYLNSTAAGADLTMPSGGTCTFDFNPTVGGDFSAAVDSAGDRSIGSLLPAGQFPTFSRLDGGAHGGVDFAEANDESLSIPYSGSASLSACANSKLCLYVVFDWGGTGVDSIAAIGDVATSITHRGWLTYNQFGSVSGKAYEGNVTMTDVGGNGPTTGTAIMALYLEHDATNGMIVGAADSAEAMTTTQNASATGDITLSNVLLASDYVTKTANLFDNVIRRAVVVEGADYDTSLATEILNSVS